MTEYYIPNIDLAIEFYKSGQTMKNFGKSKESELGIKTQAINHRIIKATRRAIYNGLTDQIFYSWIRTIKDKREKNKAYLAACNYAKDYLND